MRKFIIIGAVIILLAGAAYIAFGSSKGKENGIKFVEVTKDTIVDKALAVGQLEPRREIQVKSKISGIVKTLHVDIGYDVRAGDPRGSRSGPIVQVCLLNAGYGLWRDINPS